MTYIERVLLDFVLVAVVAGSSTVPEALLTQLVVVAALTLVAKPRERLAPTRLTLHRVLH